MGADRPAPVRWAGFRVRKAEAVDTAVRIAPKFENPRDWPMDRERNEWTEVSL